MMKKTMFKTFVYSFVFSLFVILLANRAYFRTSKEGNQEIKISGKNITLFLKDKELSPIRLASTPTKKIILSTIADIPQKNDKFEDNIELPISKDSSTEIETASLDAIENLTEQENSINSVLPIPVLKKDESPKSSASTILAAADLTITPESVESKKAIRQSLNEKHETSSIDDILTNTKIPLEQTKAQNIINTKSLSAENSGKDKNIPIAKTQPEAKEIKTVQADIVSSKHQNNAPQILIPLENSQKKVWAKAEIKSAADANRNQVALNAKDIPISSMETKKVTISEKASESTPKAWESMKEKYATKKNDDPWIVAKGKTYPNNQLLLDDKKYKINDEDVQKIFDAKKSTLTNKEENLQLASKTVKNLLIPIPEDILNDENLTPQLISSPKNKEIKEELEAKGLIKKEEAKEETKEENKTEKLTQNSEKESSDVSAKDGSILDSLTSLFAGNKNSIPEIGVNDTDDEEESNSLFSAFTRKQNRLMSKILPTEIRLSFQPNRAEISGQTLKWIKAFAQKTAEEPTTGLEIRIDGTSSPLLQRRRLNLLQNILLNEGATPEKINTVFTAREPNSFILRTVRVNKEIINTPAKNNNRYMQW